MSPKNLSTIRMLRDNVLPKLERTLENEIKEQEREKFADKFQRLRQHGRNLLHSRPVLRVVVVLCLLDSILVIGELVLDMHAIKLTRQAASRQQELHCDELWAAKNTSRHGNDSVYFGHHDDSHASTETLAHCFHYISLAILTALLIETQLKIALMGKKMLQKRFEVFDAAVVFVSFVVDLVFLKGLTNKPVEESAYILSFLLPWRVVRVVNSMIVALLQREQMRLLLVYKSKQYLQKQVNEINGDLTLLQKQMAALKSLCKAAKIEDWKINRCVGAVMTETSCRKSALSSLVSMSMGDIMECNALLMTPTFEKPATNANNSLDKNISKEFGSCESLDGNLSSKSKRQDVGRRDASKELLSPNEFPR